MLCQILLLFSVSGCKITFFLNNDKKDVEKFEYTAEPTPLCYSGTDHLCYERNNKYPGYTGLTILTIMTVRICAPYTPSKI